MADEISFSDVEIKVLIDLVYLAKSSLEDLDNNEYHMRANTDSLDFVEELKREDEDLHYYNDEEGYIVINSENVCDHFISKLNSLREIGF